MTLLGTHRRSDNVRDVVELGDADVPELEQLLDHDPLVNAVLCSRLRAIGTLAPSRLGGRMLGVRDASGLRAAVFSGGNLLPVGGDADDWRALAATVLRRSRECTSIVGRADAALGLWRELTPSWGRARAVRYAQPLLVAEHPPAVPLERRVRPMEPSDFEAYLPAAIAMFTEELGVAPTGSGGGLNYRRRVEWLIRARRAFGIVDGDGRIAFKADLGAVSPRTCQVQGVWVRPDLRGRGLGTAALAAVIDHALTLAPSVSLYVNDYNVAARRLYARLGMREVGTLATVLL